MGKTKKVSEAKKPKKSEDSKVEAFKEYLKIENPEWFRVISYSCNTVIDQYLNRYTPDVKLTKPEYGEFLVALSERDSNFK